MQSQEHNRDRNVTSGQCIEWAFTAQRTPTQCTLHSYRAPESYAPCCCSVFSELCCACFAACLEKVSDGRVCVSCITVSAAACAPILHVLVGLGLIIVSASAHAPILHVLVGLGLIIVSASAHAPILHVLVEATASLMPCAYHAGYPWRLHLHPHTRHLHQHLRPLLHHT